jgi:choline dehydrogenase-like flavoprotein
VIVDGAGQTGRVEELFDHVVIGSGAAGATTARTLTGAGASVAVVEEGPAVETADFGDRAFPALRRMYRDGGMQLTRGRVVSPVLQGRVLGGSTVVNSAIMWRLPEDVWAPWDTELGLGQALPLEELHRRWDLIEGELSVAPTPESVWGENNRRLGVAGAALGVRAGPMSRAVTGCRGSARCQSGCPFGAKQSMALTYLPYAEQRGAVLFTAALAHRVRMRGDRAEAVEGTFSNGSPFVLRARRGVVVAASAIQTPGVLRRSGVRSPHLGSHFQAHPGTSMSGVFDRPVGLWFGATQGFESDEHRRDGRFKIETVSLPPETLMATLPGVGRRWVEQIARAGHIAVWAVDLRAHAEGAVRDGRGGAIVRFVPERRDVANLRRALRYMAELFFVAGAREVLPGVRGLPERLTGPDQAAVLESGPDDPRAYPFVLSHLFGTARMSVRPEDGVVGPDFAVHGTRNLYVADSSIFPTNIGVNPQLSIMGISMLAAERIAEREG